MTLGDAKRKVLMLLDEYSSGGAITVDEDIALKMNDFFDLAQKDMAQWQPITRRTEVELDGTGEQELPGDVSRVARITRDGHKAREIEIIDWILVYPVGETGTVVMDYIATPEAITPETQDEYEFEVSEEAAACLPFFVAAQQLIADLVIDYRKLYDLYLQMRSMVPRSTGGVGGGSFRQALYGR
jgi:hypothetical protein